MPPRRPTDPPSDEEWDRRTLEGVDPEAGDVRHSARRLHEHVDTLIEMAENRERWAVLRGIIKRFAIWVAVMVAALSAFKEQLLSLFKGTSP